MTNKTTILSHPMFTSLTLPSLNRFFNLGLFTIRHYGNGQIIHMEMDPCITFDVIMEGQVMIDRIDEHGNLLSIVTFNQGDTLGGNILFSQNPNYLMTISAKNPVTLLHIKKEAIIQLLESNPPFLFHFIRDISDRANLLGQRIRRYSHKSLRDKLLDYLTHENAKQQSNPILLPVTKKALSEQLGVVRTSISRELKSMEDEGLIQVDHKTITLTFITN